VVECLPSLREALSSISSTAEGRKKGRKEGRMDPSSATKSNFKRNFNHLFLSFEEMETLFNVFLKSFFSSQVLSHP
jgi:hypothetical protein